MKEKEIILKKNNCKKENEFTTIKTKEKDKVHD